MRYAILILIVLCGCYPGKLISPNELTNAQNEGKRRADLWLQSEAGIVHAPDGALHPNGANGPTQDTSNGYCVSDDKKYAAYGPSNGECLKGYHYKRIETTSGLLAIHSGVIPEDIPPFDVPPHEWDTEEPTPGYYVCSNNQDICTGPRKGHHRECVDKSRFLLMSEDERWHCLALH